MLPTFDIPPIGPRMGKEWGVTQLLFARNGVEMWGLAIRKGGYCSRHVHKNKWNRFAVLGGRLAVRIFFDDGKVDETIIGCGQITDVSPGAVHEFEGLEESVVIEAYWTVLDANDIDRGGTKGGMRE